MGSIVCTDVDGRADACQRYYPISLKVNVVDFALIYVTVNLVPSAAAPYVREILSGQRWKMIGFFGNQQTDYGDIADFQIGNLLCANHFKDFEAKIVSAPSISHVRVQCLTSNLYLFHEPVEIGS